MQLLNRLLNRLEEVVIGSAILIVSLLILVNVVLRYLFGTGINWTEEMVRFLMILVTFVGASICVRQGSHISVDFLFNLLKGKAKKWLTLCIYLICVIFTASMAWYSLEIIQQNMRFIQKAPALQIPMYIPYLILPLGLSLCTIRYIQEIYYIFRPGNKPGKEEAL
ncbi:TRAP transporter small permease [Alkalihalobacillus oceani]|uniref:TRAP transporter small permease n=1 Tax=Halalkalibacter oceani TaxID=1653776 RepID=UPI00203B7C83|nr:TRAP transporter small permease [Halalkalibacter oceani]